MAFIDEIELELSAGKGGNGVVRWRHEKGKEYSGPSGGDGGRGGDVHLRAIRDVALLMRYRNNNKFAADPGEAGMKNSMHGKSGKDLVLELPIGSIIVNKETGKEYRLDVEGQEIEVLKGGNGGYGNEHFKASTNTKPIEWTPGKDGESGIFSIELELIADAGLVGFPNAGKSSLINALTRARAKVAAYQFTTLEPNLGDMEGFIVADIPGLIEGASEGKGLGHKFLRHIRRTKMLFHCISLENEDMEGAYKTIRGELELYDHALAEKPEVILFTKSDIIEDPKVLAKRIKDAEKQVRKAAGKTAADRIRACMAVTILDDEKMKEAKDTLVKILRAG
ncbi:MAG TPA: GTPase ObgE [Candidatus Paceibacterota bacterium]|nr:GTPase ObgE [Candidatus Paceibacterota bacterium]